MTQTNRRNFLKSSAVSVAAAAASTQTFAHTPKLSNKTIAEVKALDAKDIQATTAAWDDGLAYPIP
jgi:nitrous oxide reductase